LVISYWSLAIGKKEIVRRKKEIVRRKKEIVSHSPTLPLSHSPPFLLWLSPTLRFPKVGSAQSQLAELFNDMEIIGCNQQIDT
jgi:hypothetical protein